jgi:hypothetical protein
MDGNDISKTTIKKVRQLDTRQIENWGIMYVEKMSNRQGRVFKTVFFAYRKVPTNVYKKLHFVSNFSKIKVFCKKAYFDTYASHEEEWRNKQWLDNIHRILFNAPTYP